MVLDFKRGLSWKNWCHYFKVEARNVSAKDKPAYLDKMYRKMTEDSQGYTFRNH